MDQIGAVRFEKGSLYTRGQIHEALSGSSWAALPTRGGKVVCACLTLERNPHAPQEMVICSNVRAVRLARAFAASGAAVPVFVRTRRGGWDYTGERRVRAVIDDPGALLALVAEGAPVDISVALQLEEIAVKSFGADGVAVAPPQSPAAHGA
jgi:hypothetical protein